MKYTKMAKKQCLFAKKWRIEWQWAQLWGHPRRTGSGSAEGPCAAGEPCKAQCYGLCVVSTANGPTAVRHHANEGDQYRLTAGGRCSRRPPSPTLPLQFPSEPPFSPHHPFRPPMQCREGLLYGATSSLVWQGTHVGLLKSILSLVAHLRHVTTIRWRVSLGVQRRLVLVQARLHQSAAREWLHSGGGGCVHSCSLLLRHW